MDLGFNGPALPTDGSLPTGINSTLTPSSPAQDTAPPPGTDSLSNTRKRKREKYAPRACETCKRRKIKVSICILRTSGDKRVDRVSSVAAAYHAHHAYARTGSAQLSPPREPRGISMMAKIQQTKTVANLLGMLLSQLLFTANVNISFKCGRRRDTDAS